MKLSVCLALSAIALGLSAPAAAQFAKPEDAVKYRKAAFTVMGNHFGRLAAMARGTAPFDAKAAAENAELVASLSRLPWTAFATGTEGGDTRALPEIWKERAKFDAAADKMQAEVAKLNSAAKSGNLDQIKAAVGATGESCKACHDAYRAK